MKNASVLLIYTGGTIGMWADRRTGALRPMDLAHLEEQVPELERINVRLGAEVDTPGEHGQTEVYGVYGDFRREASAPLAAGRHITDDEANTSRRICVLGDYAARRFFPDDVAVGRPIRINGVSCEVVGVLGEPQNRDETAELLQKSHLAADALSSNAPQAHGNATQAIVGLSGKLEKLTGRKIMLAPQVTEADELGPSIFR